MFIFTASENDIPVIVGIAERTWWPTYRQILSTDQIEYMLQTIYSVAALRDAMREQAQIFLLLDDGNGPQGFAAYGKHPHVSGACKLHKLYVLPHNQGKGYGRMLIDEVKSRLLKADVHTLELNVNRHNPAIDFYEKVGFKRLREEDIPFGPYWMNDYVLRIEF